MPGSILHIDFETRSLVDLKKVGLFVYADPKVTEVICMAYAFDDEPVEIYDRMDVRKADRIFKHIGKGGDVWAHNSTFEFELWNKVFSPFTPLVLEQMTCTMVMAYSMGLPGNLAGAAAALGVDQQKDMEGSRLMLQMCKPRDILPDGTATWWETPEQMKRLQEYCVQDVKVEREIGKRMMQLSPYEKRVWILDQKINARGVQIDKPAVKNAIALVEFEKDRLDREMRRVTKDNVATCNALQQIKDYLQFYGVAEDSLAKSDVTALLENPNTHPHAKEVLKIRSLGGKAATAKLNPMLERVDHDGRLKGSFQYSGANTRRWAGRGVQLHNLKRPIMKNEHINIALEYLRNTNSVSENAMFFDIFYGSTLDAMGDLTRGFLTAAPGKQLLTVDFSAIEARVLAWLAGQDNVLDIFRANQDIYLVQASQIFSKTIVDKEDPRRQVGKVAILALGFGGGVGAFQTMAKGYKVTMAPAFEELWRSTDFETREWAEKRWHDAGEDYEISREEFLASEITKIKWREANPRIVEYWAKVEQAFMRAILEPGKITGADIPGHAHREVQFKKSGSFLWCLLPSGGVLCYPYPEIRETETPWGAKKALPTYMSEDGLTKKWQRFSTHGGSIVENITQATARDLLADAMLRLDQAGYPIVLHVHDEVVCEVSNNFGSLEEMKKIMTTNPKWAFDLPVDTSGHVSFRYRK